MTVYVTPLDFRQLGLPERALSGVPEADINRALSTASARADGYLARRYQLPLSAWGDDLRGAVSALASWWLLSARRGFNPEMGADIAVRKNYEDAIRWLEGVAAGALEPAGIEDASPDADEGAVVIATEARRGW